MRRCNEDRFCDACEALRIRLLFRAVLVRAAKDAILIRAENLRSKLNKADALSFLSGGEDLKQICELAEVDYEKICSVGVQNVKNNYKKYKKYLTIIFGNKK